MLISKRTAIIGAGLIVGALLLPLLNPATSAHPKEMIYMVKLYSGENCVATLQATSIGAPEGNLVQVTVGNPGSPKQICINGTYSIEQSY